MIEECNICWWEVKMYNPTEIYWVWYKHYSDAKDKPWKEVWYIYKCLKCKATVWCHKDTNKPFWTLADKETKRARHLCHELLDPLWKCKEDWNHNKWSRWKERTRLYQIIADKMWIPFDDMHFWMFNIEQCRVAYKIILEYKKKFL